MKLLLLALLVVCVPALAQADSDGFPTLDRVGYVMNCMAENGGQSVENLYACSCRVDAIASQMRFVDFDAASTHERYRRMPGEKGGLYRESDEGDKLLEKLNLAREYAQQNCPLVQSVGGKRNLPAVEG